MLLQFLAYVLACAGTASARPKRGGVRAQQEDVAVPAIAQRATYPGKSRWHVHNVFNSRTVAIECQREVCCMQLCCGMGALGHACSRATCAASDTKMQLNSLPAAICQACVRALPLGVVTFGIPTPSMVCVALTCTARCAER